MNEMDWKKNCNWKNGGVQYRNWILNHIFCNIRTNIIYILCFYLYWYKKSVHITYLFYIRNNPHNHPGFFPPEAGGLLLHCFAWDNSSAGHREVGAADQCAEFLREYTWQRTRRYDYGSFLRNFWQNVCSVLCFVYFAWWEKVEFLMIRVVHMQLSFEICLN